MDKINLPGFVVSSLIPYLKENNHDCLQFASVIMIVQGILLSQ